MRTLIHDVAATAWPMVSFPEDGSVDLQGLSLHYRDWGGQDQPLVLVHGLASTCHIWDLVAPILGQWYRVFALDQRGHGESGKPSQGYDFATVARDMHMFVQTMGLERPIIVGHSWGGDVALEYAVAYPEGPGGLCFVDGGTIEISSHPDMTLELAKKEMAPPDFTGVTVQQLKERARGWRIDYEHSPQMEAILLANFEVLGDDTVRARLSLDNHMRIIEAFWAHRPSALYPSVRCPVLLMPARGREGPAAARRFPREKAIALAGRLLPKSKTVWLEDSIHDVPLQRPQLVADVIREHVDGGFFH